MPFYRANAEKFEEIHFELRNAWVLETGINTETEFSYDEFVRNCRELQHFGYRYEGARGCIPRYLRPGRYGGSFIQRVYPEWIEIKTEDERFGDSGIFSGVKCSMLTMNFIHRENGKRVYLYIRRVRGTFLLESMNIMWLSESPESRRYRDDQFLTYVTWYFSEPVFGAILSRYGLLDEKKEERDAGISELVCGKKRTTGSFFS